MDRVWKKVDEFPNYSVSSDGLVRNDKRGIIKTPHLDDCDYHELNLYKDGAGHHRKIHRLVAEAFVENPENKTQVNHKDGCKTNNDVDNLEWSTASENMLHAYATGLIKPHASYGMLGKKNPNGGAKGRKIRVVETGVEYKNIAACARDMDISDRRISDVINGHMDEYMGYHFEPIE